jgi:hypothetical protein
MAWLSHPIPQRKRVLNEISNYKYFPFTFGLFVKKGCEVVDLRMLIIRRTLRTKVINVNNVIWKDYQHLFNIINNIEQS